ncbi:polysaccharide pyruvyl transferase family protein [Microvirga sp. BSC39]|uniref:polysaccharide pyruvyl transferase family protein n=1 Tax=Microvirga sp. BSC39 TaxID=1549810 RepID=UPI00136341AE|nr:polysaccharide pyruvyl transferase family protein [Microvirga sp. BSC39]
MEQTADLLNSSERVALLDFPDYDNIGDSAIYAGEIAFLERKRLKPSYVASKDNCIWSELERRIGNGPILLQGGGNFGDLWPWFQPFREEVLERYPGRPVIQFPQTIFYREQANIDRTARLIERHGAFTLLVRDQRSFDLATRSFQCDVRMCPDMAYFIGPIERGEPDQDLLLHLRRDREAATAHDLRALAIDPRILIADWPAEPPGFHMNSKLRDVLPLALAYLRGGKQSYLSTRYHRLAWLRLRRGFDLLSRGRTVITDRLHGHIMSFLLDIPHCVLDNSYGKTSTYMETWCTAGGNVSRAASLAEAEAWYRSAVAA